MTVKYWQAINQALSDELASDERVLVFGEDVAKSGGVFGVTRGLQDRFGDKRVLDTPLSEAAVVGAGVGAAMMGLRPVVELMFFDFSALSMDQLVNQGAKILSMSGGKLCVPLVVRTLCGARSGAGPQHSQVFDAWFASVPGLKVVWPSDAASAYALLRQSIRDPNPVVFIESFELLGVRYDSLDDGPGIELGQAVIRRSGGDATLVAWGGNVQRAMAAASELAGHSIDVEVVDLLTLSPLDIDTLIDSVRKTGQLFVIQDSPAPASVGSHVISAVCQAAWEALSRAPVLLAAPFSVVPFSPGLLEGYYQEASDIVDAVRG